MKKSVGAVRAANGNYTFFYPIAQIGLTIWSFFEELRKPYKIFLVSYGLCRRVHVYVKCHARSERSAKASNKNRYCAAPVIPILFVHAHNISMMMQLNMVNTVATMPSRVIFPEIDVAARNFFPRMFATQFSKRNIPSATMSGIQSEC